MIFLQSLCGFLQFLDAIGDSVTDLHSSIAFEGPGCYSGQHINNGLNNDIDEEAKSTCAVEGAAAAVLDWQWQLWTIDLLDTSHVVHVDLLFPCERHAHHTAASASGRPRRRPRTTEAIVVGSFRSRRGSSSPLRSLVAAHEEWLTYAVVVATLQVFLRLTGANVTTLFLPMLAHATGGPAAAQMGDAVVAAVNTCGVLGSALAAQQLSKEAMCAISAVLVVFCQVAVPAMMAAHAGLMSLSGGARMTGGHAAETFALACAVSGGVGWAWGALFWAVPGDGIRSARQAAGAALGFGFGFAQLQCFLLTLRQLKHAAFAYYAVWIWS